MGTSSTAVQYLHAVASFEHAATALAEADPVMLDSREVLDCLRRVETALRRCAHGTHALTQTTVEQGLPAQLGYTGIKELLVDQLRLSGAEARDRVHGARSRAPQRVNGAALEPTYPLIAAAQKNGTISDRHALAMERVFAKCRRSLSPSDVDTLEDILVTAAQDVTPDEIAVIGKHALEVIDPDGAEPSENVIARARELTVARQDDDLMSTFDGALSPEGRALLDVILEKFARPGVNNPADAAAPVDASDQAALAAAVERDTRSAGQRNHDALVLALRMAVTAGESGHGLGAHRGLPCVPIITIRLDQLESEVGIATTASGGRLPIPDALNMMEANPKYALLLDMQSRPLFLGRERRLATADQRLALYASEKGCTAPGCDAPATRCQVHHITEWSTGGATDVTQLTLACDAHHGKITPPARPGTESRPGWETITIPAGQPHAGRTGWRRTTAPGGHAVNLRHHADELYRQALANWRDRRKGFQNLWRAEDLRAQYESVVGTTYADIAKILDSPNGPPILEELLAQHDADNAWREDAPPVARAA